MKTKEKKLTEKGQRSIVVRIAQFEKPTEVSNAIKEEFGVIVTPQAVEYYDPTKNARCPKKWSELFYRERQAFIDEEIKQPCFHRAYRMKIRQRQIEKTINSPNSNLRHLDSAAKEAGGMFTNKRELTGKDGAPLGGGDLSQYSLEDLEAALRALGAELGPDYTKLSPAYADGGESLRALAKPNERDCADEDAP